MIRSLAAAAKVGLLLYRSSFQRKLEALFNSGAGHPALLLIVIPAQAGIAPLSSPGTGSEARTKSDSSFRWNDELQGGKTSSAVEERLQHPPE